MGSSHGTSLAFSEEQIAASFRRLELVAGLMVFVIAISMGLELVRVQLGVPGLLGVDYAISSANVVLSLAYLGLSRSGRLGTYVQAKLALLYLLAVPLLMAAGGASHPWWVEVESLRAAPWFCLWILFVPVVVPAPFWSTVRLTVAMVLVGPAALMWVPRWLALPPPTPQAFADVLIPAMVSGILAVASARVLHDMGRQTIEARRKARQAGSYQLETLLGRGGMGEVWLARHRMLARPAAVKLIRTEQATDAERESLRERFNREAQATAALSSVHTVELYDYGMTDDGTMYYAMELLDGLDLERMVEEFGPMSASRVVHLLRQACASLEDAHNAGLVHRDIKPANLYVCRMGVAWDFVKVLDFGLVKGHQHAAGDVKLTAAATVVGTPAFMAPEQLDGAGQADPRSDLYALGCVAFWLLTGRGVFQADTPMRMAAAHLTATPPSPSDLSELPVPPGLEALVLQCLAKAPDDRPESARALRRALAELDVPRWTEAQAERWWDVHRPERRQLADSPTGGLLHKQTA